jgi:hypothetical protein
LFDPSVRFAIVEERSCGSTVGDCVSDPEFESSAAKLLGAVTIRNTRRKMISEMCTIFPGFIAD